MPSRLLGAGGLGLDLGREGWAGHKNPIDGAGSDTPPRRGATPPIPSDPGSAHSADGQTEVPGLRIRSLLRSGSEKARGFVRITTNRLRVSQTIGAQLPGRSRNESEQLEQNGRAGCWEVLAAHFCSPPRAPERRLQLGGWEGEAVSQEDRKMD